MLNYLSTVRLNQGQAAAQPSFVSSRNAAVIFSNSRKIIIRKSGFYTVLQNDVTLTISNRANSVLFTFLPLNFLYKVPKISAVLSFCKLILPVQSFCRS